METRIPVCGFRGDPLCFPPDCGGACAGKEDSRPVRPEFKLRVDWLIHNLYGEPVEVELHTHGRIKVIHHAEGIVAATEWAIKWLRDRGFNYWSDIDDRQRCNDPYITLYPQRKP